MKRWMLIVVLFLLFLFVLSGCQNGVSSSDPNSLVAAGQGVQSTGAALSQATGNPWFAIIGVALGGALVYAGTKK